MLKIRQPNGTPGLKARVVFMSRTHRLESSVCTHDDKIALPTLLIGAQLRIVTKANAPGFRYPYRGRESDALAVRKGRYAFSSKRRMRRDSVPECQE